MIASRPTDDYERAFLWAFQYCTWPVADDAADPLPRPYAGRISSAAFNALLHVVLVARDTGTLPKVQIGPDTFAEHTSGRDGVEPELVSAGLISVDGDVWTLRIEDGEARP
jgi:hypothetical protein